MAGDHTPVIPLVDVAGNGGAVEFCQSVPIGANVGVTCGLIVIFIVLGTAH